MYPVHCDSGPVRWMYTLLNGKEYKPSNADSLRLASVCEICNSIILYDRVFYDGNISQSMIDEIQEKETRLVCSIDGKDISSLVAFTDILQGVEVDAETDRILATKALQRVIGSLEAISTKMSKLWQYAEIYEAKPISNPYDNLLKYLEADIEMTYEEACKRIKKKEVRGYRFYRLLLSVPQFREEIKKAMETWSTLKKLEGNEMIDIKAIKLLFARFRTAYGLVRADYFSYNSNVIDQKVYYRPTPERCTIEREVDSWPPKENMPVFDKMLEEELTPVIRDILDRQDWKTNTPIPIGVALMLKEHKPTSIQDFFLCSAVFSQSEDVLALKEAVRLYSFMHTQEKLEFSQELRKQTAIKNDGGNARNHEAKKTLINLMKSVTNPIGAVIEGAEYLTYVESNVTKAADAMSEVLLNVPHRGEFQDHFKQVFQNSHPTL